MSDKAYRMSRRRLGILRCLAVVIGFACIIHVTRRECAKNADRPLIPIAAADDSWTEDSSTRKLSSKNLSSEKFHATAYCLTGLTTAGVPAAPGYAAADPKVIPLGSVIYVETPFMSGVYQVMDTGELIKGKIIDIFIPSYEACKEFGRRIVKVKVLRYGFEEDSAEKKSKNR